MSNPEVADCPNEIKEELQDGHLQGNTLKLAPSTILNGNSHIVTYNLSDLSNCACSNDSIGGNSDEVLSSSRRKSRQPIKPLNVNSKDMLSHVTIRQVLLDRKPTLMESLISRSKTALLKQIKRNLRGGRDNMAKKAKTTKSEVPKTGGGLKQNDTANIKVDKSRKRKRSNSFNGTLPVLKRLRSSNKEDSEQSDGSSCSSNSRAASLDRKEKKPVKPSTSQNNTNVAVKKGNRKQIKKGVRYQTRVQSAFLRSGKIRSNNFSVEELAPVSRKSISKTDSALNDSKKYAKNKFKKSENGIDTNSNVCKTKTTNESSKKNLPESPKVLRDVSGRNKASPPKTKSPGKKVKENGAQVVPKKKVVSKNIASIKRKSDGNAVEKVKPPGNKRTSLKSNSGSLKSNSEQETLVEDNLKDETSSTDPNAEVTKTEVVESLLVVSENASSDDLPKSLETSPGVCVDDVNLGVNISDGKNLTPNIEATVQLDDSNKEDSKNDGSSLSIPANNENLIISDIAECISSTPVKASSNEIVEDDLEMPKLEREPPLLKLDDPVDENISESKPSSKNIEHKEDEPFDLNNSFDDSSMRLEISFDLDSSHESLDINDKDKVSTALSDNEEVKEEICESTDVKSENSDKPNVIPLETSGDNISSVSALEQKPTVDEPVLEVLGADVVNDVNEICDKPNVQEDIEDTPASQLTQFPILTEVEGNDVEELVKVEQPALTICETITEKKTSVCDDIAPSCLPPTENDTSIAITEVKDTSKEEINLSTDKEEQKVLQSITENDVSLVQPTELSSDIKDELEVTDSKVIEKDSLVLCNQPESVTPKDSINESKQTPADSTSDVDKPLTDTKLEESFSNVSFQSKCDIDNGGSGENVLPDSTETKHDLAVDNEGVTQDSEIVELSDESASSLTSDNCSKNELYICDEDVEDSKCDDQKPELGFSSSLIIKDEECLTEIKAEPDLVIQKSETISVSESETVVQLVTNETETLSTVIEKKEEPVQQQAMKEAVLQALGLKSLGATVEQPKKSSGTLKAVIKLNRGGDKKSRSLVYRRSEDDPGDTLEYRICSESDNQSEPVQLEHMDVDVEDNGNENEPSLITTAADDSDGAKEPNLIIPEKSSSFSIHPGRLCSDVCSYCFGKFGSLDTPCHVAQLKGEERQRKILENEPHLTGESCLCDACYRYVDRRANFPSKLTSKARPKPPASSVCCVIQCQQSATHTVKRKWLLKLKKSITNKLDIDLDKPGCMYFPLCPQHHYWVDYFTVCGICRKRLNRNHLYSSLGTDADRLNLMLAEDGIPARLSDKLFLCKLCRFYSNIRLKYSDPNSMPAANFNFYKNYRKKILLSLDIPVTDSEDEGSNERKRMKKSNEIECTEKVKEEELDSVMSLSGLATLLGEQPEPQARIQLKFGNVNIGTLSNLNIGQGRPEDRSTNYESSLPLAAHLEFQGPSTPDGSWEKCVSTLQFDKKTKKLWNDLQRPYGNQSSFLRHLVMLEKYWREGYLVLAENVDDRAAKYISSVRNRIKSFEGATIPSIVNKNLPEVSQQNFPQSKEILKIPNPKKIEETPQDSKSFCPLLTNTGEIEVTAISSPPPKLTKPTLTPSQANPILSNKVSQVPMTSRPSMPMSLNPSVSKPPGLEMANATGRGVYLRTPQPIVMPQERSKQMAQMSRQEALDRAKSLVRMAYPLYGSSRMRLPSPLQRVPSPVRARNAVSPVNYQYSPVVSASQINTQWKMAYSAANRPPALLKISQSNTPPPQQLMPHYQSSSITQPMQIGQCTVTHPDRKPQVSIFPSQPKKLTPILPKLPKHLTVTQIPASGSPAITLPYSGVTIEKQSGSAPTTMSLPIEKPSISVFREPLPTDSS